MLTDSETNDFKSIDDYRTRSRSILYSFLFLFIPIYSYFTGEQSRKKRTIDLKLIKKSIIRVWNFNFSLFL